MWRRLLCSFLCDNAWYSWSGDLGCCLSGACACGYVHDDVEEAVMLIFV